MFRFSRPLLNAVTKRSTGITGLNVHSNPLPKLVETYKSTLSVLSSMPSTAVYRQAAEAMTKHRLSIVEKANGSISAVESELQDGQIEQTLDIATDELNLAKSMLEWKA
jgi:NADH dehydrogenase (ubiquinone) 1 alpha subcomplex subunit 5